MAVEHKYVLKDYNLSYILYNQWEKMYSGFCFLSVGTVVRYTENDHICYFTITVVASMSPNGLTLFTSVSTINCPVFGFYIILVSVLPLMTKLEATAYPTGSLFTLPRNHSDNYLDPYPNTVNQIKTVNSWPCWPTPEINHELS